LATEEYLKNEIIFAYVSKELEVDTIFIIKTALADKKTVAVPRCSYSSDKKDIEMEFYGISSFSELRPGAFGILEPIAEQSLRIRDFSEGVCIVPGLAVDLKGFRLGYGKGYYDRFLANFKGCTAGLCYSNCVADALPKEDFDLPIDLLITDLYVRKHKNQRDCL
jgi:5-formyltetrahydrofolate cyclo-ligase